MSEGPVPVAKIPVLRKHGGVVRRVYKKARGFSKGEIKAVGLSVFEARRLGIYVDERRKSVHEENVKVLKEWVEKVNAGEITVPRAKMALEVVPKPAGKRVFMGKTMAGRRGRGLLSLKLRHTHSYKWKRKQRERLLKKRHEARRHKGGH